MQASFSHTNSVLAAVALTAALACGGIVSATAVPAYADDGGRSYAAGAAHETGSEESSASDAAASANDAASSSKGEGRQNAAGSQYTADSQDTESSQDAASDTAAQGPMVYSAITDKAKQNAPAAAKLFADNLFDVDFQANGADALRRARTEELVPISNATVIGLFPKYDETGGPIEPEIDLVLDGRTLQRGVDYELLFDNNIVPGTAKLTVLGKGAFGGSGHVMFEIVANDQATGQSGGKASDAAASSARNAKASVLLDAATRPASVMAVSASPSAKRDIALSDVRCLVSHVKYTGKKAKPVVKLSFHNEPLLKGVDYTLEYADNRNAGTASVTATGIGRYAGTITRTFAIDQIDLSGVQIGEVGDQLYTGEAIKPAPEIVLDGKTLKRSRDYRLVYSDNVEAGTATITVQGRGNYVGSASIQFEIVNPASDLAHWACIIAYSRPAYHGQGYNGTAAYASTFKSVGLSGISRSCDAGITTAIRAAGCDYSFPKALANIVTYLGYSSKAGMHGQGSPKTSKWQKIGRYSKGDEWTTKMQPGDIVVSGGHICMFVGEAAAQETYDLYLKGTDADLGRPKSDEVWVSAHYNGGLNTFKNAAPCIGNRSYALPGVAMGPGYIYRCVNVG